MRINSKSMSREEADIDLILWNAEASSIDSSDLYVWLRESGLPPEIAIRLKNLIDFTEKVADKVIYIGKIVLIKIIEFIKDHPNLSIGIALGVAVSVMINSIPFFGPILSPLALVLGISAGMIVGHRMDKAAKGISMNNEFSIVSISQDVIEIAKEFFQLVIDVFNVVFDGR